MNLTQIIKSAQDLGAMVAAGVGVLSLTDEVDGAQKKTALTTAIKTVAQDFKLTVSDTVISIVIEVIYVVGKLKGILGASGSASPASGGPASKTT